MKVVCWSTKRIRLGREGVMLSGNATLSASLQVQ